MGYCLNYRNKSKIFHIQENSYKLNIWDTGGSERYRAMAPMYYRDAQAAILVVDVTNLESLDEARDWLMELREHGMSDCLIIGAANKIDLYNDKFGF